MTTAALIAAAVLAAQSPDINGDGMVNGVDQGILLSKWGPHATNTHRADFNEDGVVNGADLGILLGAWSGNTTMREIVVTDAAHGSPVVVPVGAEFILDDSTRRYIYGWGWHATTRTQWPYSGEVVRVPTEFVYATEATR